MMQQQMPEWLFTIDQWAQNSDRTPLTEGELIGYLRSVEEARNAPQDEGAPLDSAVLDRAEAAILTRMAELRWQKTGGDALTEDWLNRAFLLSPEDPLVMQLIVQLYLEQLQQHLFFSDYPRIRETDNAPARKRQVELMIEKAAKELEDANKWNEMIQKVKKATSVVEDKKSGQLAEALQRLYMEREALLHQLKQQAEAYAESLKGMFFSSDLLGALQDTIRQLAAQQEKKAALMLSSDREEKSETPSVMQQIDELIGMEEIKLRVNRLSLYYQYQKIRNAQGWRMEDQLPLHLVLMGNPGTGKTTLARLIAQLYHNLGLLERSEVIEVDRSHLVGAYVGQTEQRTMDVIKRAAGGVLFIDEAYSLKRADSAGSDYGQVAIDTLVAAMTSGEYAGKFVVILAGYPEEMRHFLQANPGLRSRFPETGHFLLPDFTPDELVTIAEKVANRNDFSLTEGAKRALQQRIERERVDETFGNARTVTNIVMDAIFAKGRKMNEHSDLHIDDFTILYPEDVEAAEDVEEEHQPELSSTARQRLDRLIGLESIKEEMKKISAFVTVQKQRLEKGLPVVPIELHAVFTGNPGTGKTTVAKLYAEILQESGYLKRGHLVVASRADLVAGFVGQTAALTRRKIREALGGVLFIDEAYSLTAGSESDFGREAIITLVDEMTKHGENLVVVLAGYPLEMERLIQSNPGLASRFKKYFFFPDYTAMELSSIIEKLIDEMGYQITGETSAMILEKLLELTQEQSVHGNGRFARTVVQEAIQNQALRIADQPAEQITVQDLRELSWEDFRPIFSGEKA